MLKLELPNIIRMWDTYLAEEQRFSIFIFLYFVKFSPKLLQMDFQDIIMFFQNVPTKDWPEGEIQVLFSEAFMWLFCKINPCKCCYFKSFIVFSQNSALRKGPILYLFFQYKISYKRPEKSASLIIDQKLLLIFSSFFK